MTPCTRIERMSQCTESGKEQKVQTKWRGRSILSLMYNSLVEVSDLVIYSIWITFDCLIYLAPDTHELPIYYIIIKTNGMFIISLSQMSFVFQFIIFHTIFFLQMSYWEN